METGNLMRLDSQNRLWPMILSVLLLTVGLTGLWNEDEPFQFHDSALADNFVSLDRWEISGSRQRDAAVKDFPDPTPMELDPIPSCSVTGPLSMPFDEREQERSRILRDLDNRSATLTQDLRREWQESQKDFESRMRAILGGEVATVSSSTPMGTLQPVRTEHKSSNHKKVEQMVYPIVQLKGNGTVGSGVVVANEPGSKGGWQVWILSAFHVVEEVRDFRVYDSKVVDIHLFDPHLGRVSEETFRGWEVVAYPEADLSLLKVNRPTPWPYLAHVASEEICDQLSVFDTVYAVGCPLGNQPIPTRGEISSQYKPVGDEVYWMVSAPTFFGNSGGGIFLSESGLLVGISSMIYTYGKRAPMVVPHMGLFVPLAQVRSWLRREGFAHLLAVSEGIPVTTSGVDQDAARADFGSF